jgi:hypothetical protein
VIAGIALAMRVAFEQIMDVLAEMQFKVTARVNSAKIEECETERSERQPAFRLH